MLVYGQRKLMHQQKSVGPATWLLGPDKGSRKLHTSDVGQMLSVDMFIKPLLGKPQAAPTAPPD